jgi:phage internal scaffolding protein
VQFNDNKNAKENIMPAKNEINAPLGPVSRDDDRIVISQVETPRGVRKRVQIDCTKDGRTEQNHGKACDINNIMKKYEKTGLVSHINENPGMYADVSSVDDYLTAMNKVLTAQEMFAALPSSIRNRFENDPAQFLDFASNPDNRQEMVEMGLLSSEMVKAKTAAQKSSDGQESTKNSSVEATTESE